MKNKNIYQFFAERIKEERQKIKLTQEELAERAKISGKFLSNIERNITKPSLDTVYRIIRALGIKPEDFFKSSSDSGFSKNPPTEAYLLQIKHLLRNSSTEELKAIIHIIKLILKIKNKPKHRSEAWLIN